MATDRDTQQILDRLDNASDHLTELPLTGRQARTLANHVYELTEIRGEVGDLRDRLVKADIDLQWEQTLRHRVEARLRSVEADNTAMIQQREQIRAILDEEPSITITIDGVPSVFGNGPDLRRRILAALDGTTPKETL